jgi:hypothetical protein
MIRDIKHIVNFNQKLTELYFEKKSKGTSTIRTFLSKFTSKPN